MTKLRMSNIKNILYDITGILNIKQTSSTFLLGMWKNDNNNFNLTCVCKSGKQSLMFRKTSALSWEQIEPPVQESLDVPSLLCSHNDVSLSLTFAILNRVVYFFPASGLWRQHDGRVNINLNFMEPIYILK